MGDMFAHQHAGTLTVASAERLKNIEMLLAADDETEATGLGLSAGDFVLYIKAEQPEYLAGEKFFTLKTDGYAETTFTMQIVEAEDAVAA